MSGFPTAQNYMKSKGQKDGGGNQMRRKGQFDGNRGQTARVSSAMNKTSQGHRDHLLNVPGAGRTGTGHGMASAQQ